MLILCNRVQWRGFIVRLFVTTLLLSCITWFVALGRSAETIGASRKTVLVLYGDPLSAPADRMTERGLTAALSSPHGWNLEVFSEYLDLMRFPNRYSSGSVLSTRSCF